MGLVSRFASYFRGRSGPAPLPTSTRHPLPDTRADDDRSAAEPGEPSDDSFASAAPDRALVEVRPVAVAARRGKQELLDDLERRYHEVVELIRKVDDHLDRADERSSRMADLANRLLEAVERLPSTDSEHDQRRHTQQVELLQRLIETQSAGAERLDTTLTRLGDQAESAGHSREQLVMTLAEFRETMGDVARTNARAAAASEDSARSQHERDDRLSSILVGNRRWMIGLIAASTILAVAALAVAIIALFTMRP